MNDKNYQYKEFNKNFKLKYLKYKKKYTNLKKQIGGDSPLSICVGKRDGVSGCRRCCKYHFDNNPNYSKCVDLCMNF